MNVHNTKNGKPCNGGNLIKGSVRITKQQVEDTINCMKNNLFPFIKLDWDEVRVIGTAGKKESSGDIDIAVPKNFLFNRFDVDSMDDLYEAVRSAVKAFEVVRSGNIISIGHPIIVDGEYTKDIVQVDLMVTDDVGRLEWALYGTTEEESAYKGRHRAILLCLIAKHCLNIELHGIHLDENNMPTYNEWSRMVYFEGLLTMKEFTNIGKNGRKLKRPKELYAEQHTESVQATILTLFPYSLVRKDELMTVEQILAQLVSHWSHIPPKIVRTLEAFQVDLIKDGTDLPEEYVNQLEQYKK